MKDVLHYIEENLREEKLNHTLSVAKLAAELAHINGVDVEKARLAALLHDCTKEKSFTEQLNLLEKYNIILEYDKNTMKPCLHADTGAQVAKDIFDVDIDVYNAIKYHTLAKENMSKLEKIIFIADKCEELRDLESEKTKGFRDIARRDLDLALETIISDNLIYLEKKGRKPYIGTLMALKQAKEENNGKK